jgi:hypothetical protein
MWLPQAYGAPVLGSEIHGLSIGGSTAHDHAFDSERDEAGDQSARGI